VSTNYRELYGDEELMKIASQISEGINDLEPDQIWTSIDTCMVAFAKLIDLRYSDEPDLYGEIVIVREQIAREIEAIKVVGRMPMDGATWWLESEQVRAKAAAIARGQDEPN